MNLPEDRRKRIGEISRVFLKLGFTAIGGPAASIAMMRQETVVKRKWLSEEEFLDYWGISNLVPGPNATELAIHIGYKHAGWPGLIAAGLSYILPAMGIVLVLAWAYVQFGTLPALDGVLYGVKPVVVAILAWALVGMLRPRVKQWVGLLVAAGVLAAYLFGVSPLVLLLAGGGVMWLVNVIRDKARITTHSIGIFASPVLAAQAGRGSSAIQPAASVLGLPQSRVVDVRQRLRPAGLHPE